MVSIGVVELIYRYEIYVPRGTLVPKTLGDRYLYPGQAEVAFPSGIAPRFDYGGACWTSQRTQVNADAKSTTDNGLIEGSLKVFSYRHYGEVFRGWLDKKTYSPSKSDSGLTIAIKRLYLDKFKPHKLNMKILEEINDPNVVKILGYCMEEDLVPIIYEFMHQGTLKEYLFSIERMTERHRLFSRVKIATGVVRGLIFLRTQPQHADCSLKIHNILLDEGNVGLIFTKGDLKEVNEEVAKYKRVFETA
ncbi:probable serine/threonine-protein kinase PBL1 isoform X2 [Tanacetum coccineum]